MQASRTTSHRPTSVLFVFVLLLPLTLNRGRTSGAVTDDVGTLTGSAHSDLERNVTTPNEPCWEVLQLCEYGTACPIDERNCQLDNFCNNNIYNTNVYHQLTEFVFRIVELGIGRWTTPEVIWWRFSLLPVSQELLQIIFPRTTIVTGYDTERPASCSTAYVIHQRKVVLADKVKRPKAISTGAMDMLRKKVYGRCKIEDIGRATPSNELKVRVIERTVPSTPPDNLTKCSVTCTEGGCAAVKQRNLAEGTYEAIRETLQGSTLLIAGQWRHLKFKLEREVVPLEPEDLCTQVARYAGAHVVISIHGAQSTFASFMRPKVSMLVEVMPWENHQLMYYQVNTVSQAIGYLQLLGSRPQGADGRECRPLHEKGLRKEWQYCLEYYRDCFKTPVKYSGCVSTTDYSCISSAIGAALRFLYSRTVRETMELSVLGLRSRISHHHKHHVSRPKRTT